MIKELKLENIEIEDGEKNIVAQSGQGKILKVLFNPTEVNSGVRLRIFTKEGEMILNVTQGGLLCFSRHLLFQYSQVLVL